MLQLAHTLHLCMCMCMAVSVCVCVCTYVLRGVSLLSFAAVVECRANFRMRSIIAHFGTGTGSSTGTSGERRQKGIQTQHSPRPQSQRLPIDRTVNGRVYSDNQLCVWGCNQLYLKRSPNNMLPISPSPFAQYKAPFPWELVDIVAIFTRIFVKCFRAARRKISRTVQQNNKSGQQKEEKYANHFFKRVSLHNNSQTHLPRPTARLFMCVVKLPNSWYYYILYVH